MATLKDIAKMADVSICTVSKYLDKSLRVKPETARKIDEAITKLNYMPNIVAKSLKKSATYNVALILPHINNHYYSEITSAIGSGLERHGYSLYIVQTSNDKEGARQIMRNMVENMAAGVIMLSMAHDFSLKNELDILLNNGIPVVFANRFVPYENYPLIYPDFTEAYKLAVMHLYERGASNIAICVNKTPDSLIHIFIKVFKNIFGCAPLIIDVGMHEIYSDYTSLARNIIDNGLDGLFILNELKAVMIMKSLIKLGVNIPGKVRIVAFGRSVASRLCTPDLSCIDLDNTGMGDGCARLILNQINSVPVENVTVLKPRLVSGGSS